MKNNVMPLSKAWGHEQIAHWHNSVRAAGKKRDYAQIVQTVNRLPSNTHLVERYADIFSDDEQHPAFMITVGDLHNGKPNILITGGVHGYEPSGVQATIQFVREEAPSLAKIFNFVAFPCISPWAYEYDQRWNWQAQDPNRQFSRNANPQIDECRQFMNAVENLGVTFNLAVDLHETSDRDIELRQMRAFRFDTKLAADYRDIPQGFYVILSEGDNARQQDFGDAIVNAVKIVSPIAPEPVILEKRNQRGVLVSPDQDGLMRTYLGGRAKHVAVTEVYPDHRVMTPRKSIVAQIAAIRGAISFIHP